MRSTAAEASPGNGPRRAFIELARRTQVVDAAINAIAELGYPAASLARIAEYAGTSKGVLTYHFKDKEDLVRAVVETVLARAGDYVGDRIGVEISAARMPCANIIANLGFFGEFRNDIIALVEIYFNAPDEKGHRLYGIEMADVSIGPLESLLRDGQSTGELGQFDARAMALAIRGTIDGIPSRLANDSEFDLERYGEALAQAFERATSAKRRRDR